jgi:hypothetical protein
MSDFERLKQQLAAARDTVRAMDDWMKTQEPAPGNSYEDWIHSSVEDAKDLTKPHISKQPLSC